MYRHEMKLIDVDILIIYKRKNVGNHWISKVFWITKGKESEFVFLHIQL